jgi:hypothetical protein
MQGAMKKRAKRNRAASYREKLETHTQEMSKKLSRQSFVRKKLEEGKMSIKRSCTPRKKKKS